MTRCMAHRGPDAEAFFSDSHVGFGHKRLSIIDLSSAANQPMTSSNGRWVIMFNGEVYNYQHLSRKINGPLRTNSDTEVMLELFAERGADAVQEFNGMFAIAVYDKIEKSLFLFRDRLGVKPLFYFNEGNEWFFASELKALLNIEHLKKRLTLNHEAISCFLQLGYIPEPLTIWNEIKKFPAGCYLKITETKHDWKYYWRAEDKISSLTITNLDEAKKQLYELLESS
ncbi:MAG: asparagine synthetase B family protein, partial [Chitinophagales bacterium]